MNGTCHTQPSWKPNATDNVQSSNHSRFNYCEMRVLLGIALRINAARDSEEPVIRIPDLTRDEAKDMVEEFASREEKRDLKAKFSTLAPNDLLSNSTAAITTAPSSIFHAAMPGPSNGLPTGAPDIASSSMSQSFGPASKAASLGPCGPTDATSSSSFGSSSSIHASTAASKETPQFGAPNQLESAFKGVASAAVQKAQFGVMSKARAPAPAFDPITPFDLTGSVFTHAASTAQQAMPLIAETTLPPPPAPITGGIFSQPSKFLQPMGRTMNTMQLRQPAPTLGGIFTQPSKFLQ